MTKLTPRPADNGIGATVQPKWDNGIVTSSADVPSSFPFPLDQVGAMHDAAHKSVQLHRDELHAYAANQPGPRPWEKPVL